MSESTPLDQAHREMEKDPSNDAARLRFYERLGDAELYLLLETEAEGDQISPRVLDPGSGPMVLLFDRAERLTAFVGGPAPYAALSGRTLFGLLAKQNLGLGLNLNIAPSSFLLDNTGVKWLAQTLQQRPERVDTRLRAFWPPADLPEALLTALDAKLAMATGLAQIAYLVATENNAGGRGHLLAFIGVLPGAERALTTAISETLIFSGLEAGMLDIGFFKGEDPVVERLMRVGLRFDLPQLTPPATPEHSRPGMNPQKPPRLR